MRQIVLIFLVCCSFHSIAQKTAASKAPVNEYAAIDKKALQLQACNVKTTADIASFINANFTSHTEKARALYVWLGSNIEYDVANMYALNFYQHDKIGNTLITRKGICENYAAIFSDVCRQCSITSYVISGYTKSNGAASYLPHAWCAAKIDSTWYMFDPTWGSGYLSGGSFVRKLNGAYFKVPPSKHVASHMPFDPMWEFVNYPVTNQEFYEGKTQQNKSKPYFSYADSIQVYEGQDTLARWRSEARRIAGNGMKNSLIYDRLQHIQRCAEVYDNNQQIARHNEAGHNYNLAVADYNDAVNRFNEFVQYRNNQFKPAKTDPEIQEMVDAADNKLLAAKLRLAGIHDADASVTALINALSRSLADAQSHVDEQKEFLTRYFSKGKTGRKSMFYKYTWMGIPLN